MPINASSKIVESDLIAAMDQFATLAGERYHPEEKMSKNVYMFVIKQAGNASGGSIPISSSFHLNVGDPPMMSQSYPYSLGWPFGFGESILCNVQQGSTESVDLYRHDLRELQVYEPAEPKDYYFAKPYTICFSTAFDICTAFEIAWLNPDQVIEDDELVNPNDPTPNDNRFERLLFYNLELYPGFHECLGIAEMNFHFEEMRDLNTDNTPDPAPEPVEIGNIEVGYNALFGANEIWTHAMLTTYIRVRFPTKEFLTPTFLPNRP